MGTVMTPPLQIAQIKILKLLQSNPGYGLTNPKVWKLKNRAGNYKGIDQVVKISSIYVLERRGFLYAEKSCWWLTEKGVDQKLT